jgi:hypothetical protein
MLSRAEQSKYLTEIFVVNIALKAEKNRKNLLSVTKQCFKILQDWTLSPLLAKEQSFT